MVFEKNVFINCPFDTEYFDLLRPLIFCVLDLGFEPRIALESLNSSDLRVEKIISLISESKFSIHDISRLRAKRKGEFYRLNMPFELGLDVGCRRFRRGQWAEKRCLILEAEGFRYKAALSDISGSDIAVHGNKPVEIVKVVRDWLNLEAGLRAAGPAAIWGRFTDFMADNYDLLKARGFSDQNITDLPIGELITCIKDWLNPRR